MIEARLLTKVFRDRRRGEVRATDGVSFSVKAGMIYGLLGANGAGKTTTLRLLATPLRPTAGSASVCGYDTVSRPDLVRANLGFLSAGTALYARLTARETIAYFGRLNGMGDAALRQRIDVLATRLDMHDFLDRRCDKLSTGMRQKTSIARTIVHDPAVLIFDEPTLGLDVMTARSIVKFVRESRESGKAVIYSTHIMAEAERLCDVFGIIDGGRLMAEGSLAELRAKAGAEYLEDCFVRIVAREAPP
ncbi:MAG TPA: ATP-binding cassette domain-containing protein [Opitutaceae bacterium]